MAKVLMKGNEAVGKAALIGKTDLQRGINGGDSLFRQPFCGPDANALQIAVGSQALVFSKGPQQCRLLTTAQRQMSFRQMYSAKCCSMNRQAASISARHSGVCASKRQLQ